jgi:sigma-E factor negative regulatory protein RseC
MTGECGTVAEIRGGDMRVEAEPGQACGSCAGKASCMFSKNQTMRSLWMNNGIGARRGDIVEFDFHENVVVKASLIAYGLPMVFLITGIIAGNLSAERRGIEKDLASILAGAAATIIAFLMVGYVSKRPAMKKSMSPVAVRIISKPDKKA